jgi:hypothetical protein
LYNTKFEAIGVRYMIFIRMVFVAADIIKLGMFMGIALERNVGL